MTRTGKARLIIGTFASLAATWSAATAAIPVIGPVLADTAGLTVLTVAMAYSLAALYDKTMDSASLYAFASVAVGAIAGQLALKVCASIIPIFGSYFNASVTFILHGAIGWALCEIFESGRTPVDCSTEELKELFKRNKGKAEEEKKRYDAAMASLPQDARQKVKDLQSKIKDKKLSDFERNELMKEITSIFEKHGSSSIFDV
ncbi:hypothetical protein VU08_03900 [Desulfobulbus sp. F5]|nr:hypothetical protein [Desulfobulbus sp. F5]